MHDAPRSRTRLVRWIPPILLGAPLLLITAVVCPVLEPPGLGAQEETASADAAATDPIFHVGSTRTRTRIVERFSKVIELDTRIRRVDGFDPEVLSVTGIQGRPNQIRVHALAPGVTTLSLTDEHGEIFTIEAFVTGDVRHLQAYLERMFPHASVEAVEVRDSVVLRGWVTQPANITKMVEIAEQFYPRVLNQMDVGGAQQVQLRVKVMEVQRSKLRRLGINWLYFDGNEYYGITPGALSPIGGITGATPGAAPSLAVNTFGNTNIFAGLIGNDEVFQVFIDALKTEALLKVLAEPELTTTNGRPANMLAGGEFPILVPQSLGTTTIEWREFGVRLEAVPHLLGRGRVRLELQPEVSERDFTNAVQIQGTTVPGLTTRRVNTQVEMKFGETFVLAGLITSRRDSTTQKVPFFGELPWIGAAFRRVQYTEAETELVIMVTPELVGPLSRDQIPPGGPGLFTDTPTDRELFRDGMIEVPYYGSECGDCEPGYEHYVPATDPAFSQPLPGQPLPGTAYPQGDVPFETLPPGQPLPGPALGPGASRTSPAGRDVARRTPSPANRPTGRPGMIGPSSGKVQQVGGTAPAGR
jgi:pilus assembly protein CpaC